MIKEKKSFDKICNNGGSSERTRETTFFILGGESRVSYDGDRGDTVVL